MSSGRKAPWADALRALTAPAERAQRATTDLARLAHLDDALTDATLGLRGEVIAEVRAAWPELAGDTAGALREALTPIAAQAPDLLEQLRSLRRAQHAALHDPAWADLVAHAGAQAAELDAVRGQLAGIDAERRAIEHLRAGLSQPFEPGAAPAVRAAFEGLLRTLGVRDPAPGIDDAPSWLVTLRASLDARQPAVDLEHARLSAQADALYDDLVEILG